MSEMDCWKTLKGSHYHNSQQCANFRRAIESGDPIRVTSEEFNTGTLEPCSVCCTPTEIQAWVIMNRAAESAMCPNNGVVNPRRVRSTCRDCGKEGKVNRATGTLRAHKRQN